MEITDRNIDDYLASLPDDVRDDMTQLDAEIGKVMKGLPRELWEGKFWGGSEQEIIGYGHLAYERSRGTKVEWFIVGLALQKNYISVYVSAVEDGKYLSERYGKELGKVKVGKSSISFRQLADIDLGKLVELCRKARQISV